MLELIEVNQIVLSITQFTLYGFLLGLTSFILGLGISSVLSVLWIMTR